jgi:hypothetical protein
MTMTSTYDHRVIQGAQSGEFLATVHRLLLGENKWPRDRWRNGGYRWRRNLVVVAQHRRFAERGERSAQEIWIVRK